MSATTRSPRPGEQDGVHYWFVSDEEFDRMVAEDELLEWAVVHQAARYGTPRKPVEQALADGQARAAGDRPPGRAPGAGDDARGALRVPDAAALGRAGPPAGRSGDREPRRNGSAGWRPHAGELAAEAEFDVTIVNHEVHAAAEELVALVCSEVADR